MGSFMVSSEKGIVYESADVHPVAMFIKKYLAAAQLNGEPLNGYLSPEMLEIGYDKDRPTHRLTVTFYISPEYKEFILKHNKGLSGTYPIRGKSICDPEPPQELGDAFFSLLSEIHKEFDPKEFSIAVGRMTLISLMQIEKRCSLCLRFLPILRVLQPTHSSKSTRRHVSAQIPRI